MTWRRSIWPRLALLLALVGRGGALDNGLARLPPMGWMAWQRFTCELDCARRPDECIHERLFKQQARRLFEDGFAALGYQLVAIDDCWSELERAPGAGGGQARLVANSTRFPGGLGRLARHMHRQHLKLGLYGDCGARTCAGFPGQLAAGDLLSSGRDNHFQTDANSLADWQVDAFKLDGCHVRPQSAPSVCPQFARALRAAGRPVQLTCEWPFYQMYTHTEPDWLELGRACNAWRYYDDIEG